MRKVAVFSAMLVLGCTTRVLDHDRDSSRYQPGEDAAATAEAGAPSDAQLWPDGGGGACGQGCQPVALATNEYWSWAIAVDATHVYWLLHGDVGPGIDIRRVPITGGIAESLLPAPIFGDKSSGMVIDSTSAYFTQEGGLAVSKVPLTGGAPTVVAADQVWPSAIAVDATSVYWTNGATIMKAGLDGGPPVTLAANLDGVHSLVVDATSVYWTSSYWGHSVMKVGLTGGAPVTLAAGLPAPGQMAIHATGVYWLDTSELDANKGSVMTVSLEGGAPVTLVSGQKGPAFIAVDATGVYWTGADPAADAGTIQRVPLGGGVPEVLATDQPWPGPIALDDGFVYWANGGFDDSGQGAGHGSIMKLAK